MSVNPLLNLYSFKQLLSSQGFVRIPLSYMFPGVKSPGLLVFDTTQSPPVPVPLKLGDANLDGFPDLLAIISSDRDHIPKLIFSVACAKGVVGCEADGTGRRGWKIETKGVESLDAVNDARGVSFLDMDEDVWQACLYCKTATNTSLSRGRLTF